MTTILQTRPTALDNQTPVKTESWLFSPALPAHRRCFYLVVFTATLAVWSLTLGSVPIFPVDDAYITLHNAQVIWRGHDPNFPGTSPLCGATSAVHLALVAFLMSFMKPLWALSTAGWLSAIAYVLALSRLAFVHRASIPVAALFVIAGSILALTPHQLMNGLETGLALAAVAWILVYASDKADQKNRILPILCGTIPFIRPEYIALSAILMALRCYHHWMSGTDHRTSMRACITDLSLSAAAAAPWLAWYWISTGTPYPTTIAAKRAFFAEGGLPAGIKTQWVSAHLFVFFMRIGVFSLAVLGLALSRTGKAALLFCLIFLGCYWTQFPGALSHYQQRYLYIILPFILYGALVIFGRGSRLARISAVVLLIIAVCQSLFTFPAHWQLHKDGVTFTRNELARVADGCNANLPKDSVVLVHDVGYISYATNFRMVDLVGLKTPSSIEDHLHRTLPSSGRRRWEAIHKIALRSKADYIIVLKGWEKIYGIAYGLQRNGWKLRLLNDKNAAYRVYALTPPSRVTHNP